MEINPSRITAVAHANIDRKSEISPRLFSTFRDART